MKKLFCILSILLILCLSLAVVSCKDKEIEDDVNGTDQSQAQSDTTDNGERPPSEDNTDEPPVTSDTSDAITGEFDIGDKENGWD